MAQSISQEAIGATGLPGATAASRHAGATTSGAPTTGTFAVGDYVVDQTGAMYVCTVAGTPGTWTQPAVPLTENVAGKNFIINGGMDIWQRGTTSSSAGYQTADRWWFNASASTTQSQSTSTVPPGSQYSFKMLIGGSAASVNLRQVVETKNTLPLAGQTVTFSGLVQASASVGMTLTLYYSTVVDDNVSSGAWVGVAGTGGSTTGTAVSGSWTRIAGTFLIPSTAQSLLIYIANTSGTVASATSIYLGQLQLEIAPQATPFSRAGGSIGGELALCQRYFEMSFAQGVTPANGSSTTSIATAQGMWGGSGSNVSPNYPSGFIPFKVEKRTASYTVTSYGNSLGYWGYGIGPGTPTFNASVVAFYNYSTNGIGISNQAINATMVSMFGHWTVSAEL